MELKLKSLCLLSVIFILMAVLPNDGRRVAKKKSSRFIKIRKTPRPPITSSSIPKEKCGRIFRKPPPPKRFGKGPICVLLNETQKIARLQEVGGYLPRYVAVNRKEALQFQSLLGDLQPIPTRPPGSSPYNNQSDLSSILGQQDKTAGNRKRRSVITLPSEADTTTIQECFDGGSLLEDDDGFRRLCTECFAISQLPDGVFPPFINEVICGDDSDFCVPGIGECQQRVIKLNVLEFTGEFERNDALSEELGVDAFVEKLEIVEAEIRACCECRLFAFLGS